MDTGRIKRVIYLKWIAFIHWGKQSISPALLAAIGVFIIGIVVLFVPPYIGLADNGDFFRVFSSNNMYVDSVQHSATQFGYFVKDYPIYEYFNEQNTAFFSSQSVFIQAALFVNNFFLDGVFDIRFLAVIYLLFLVVAIYLLVEGITVKMQDWRGYMVAIFAVLIFGDTAYLAYFNSFFGEGLMMIAMLYIAASLLLMYQNRYNDYWMLGLFFVSSIVLITTKQQNAPVAIVIGVLGLLLLFIKKNKAFKVWVASALGVIVLTGVLMYAFIPETFVTINKYQTMTRGVILDSENPEKDLREMGINEQFALLKGTTYFQKYKMVETDSAFMEDHFYSHFGFVPVLKFYVGHPDALLKMLNLSAEHAFTIRPLEMGNYEESAGKPFGAKTGFFTLYSTVKHNASPSAFGMIVLWAVAVTSGYSRGIIQKWHLGDFRGMLRLDLVLILVGTSFSVLLTTIVGDGEADLAKHEFLFNVCFDIVLLMVLASLTELVGKQIAKRRAGKHV
ncbi:MULTISPECIES: hypothetical protein [Listeria]|uniref:glycan biosynthesis hexose transferase WsfD n=1 Tax=Listeria TaxID=1637 RepID=UPI000B589BD4|nr:MULTISPECIES: hypothetical protein [Listeria]